MTESTEDTISVDLTKQLKLMSGDTTSKLVFREPELGDAIDAEESGGGPVLRMAFILARMCGVGIDDFRKIRPRDFNRIEQKTKHWLDDEADGEEVSALGNGEQDGEISPS